MKTIQIFLILAASYLGSFSAYAQVLKTDSLYKQILKQDSLLFDVGFNTCNISQTENLISEDFEFLHDKNGISNRNKFLKDFANGLCKDPENYQARRQLMKEGSQVFALKNNGIVYGAIQEGIHQFFEKQPGSAERFGSSAKFTHVWLLESGQWKLSRVLSFEHVQELLLEE